jgi:molybdate transport system substrate-binding protein
VIRWVLACLLLATPVEAADLTLLTTGAFKPVADAVIPAFEARTGSTVTERNDTAGALVRRIKANEKFDVALLSATGVTDLEAAGKIVPGSATPVAKVGVGVAVKAGAAKPDISTVAAFKAAMLNAKSVAYVDPKSGGSSGIYVAKLFQTLGIAAAMAPKSVLVNGGLAAQAVADGRAEIAVQQASELLTVPGITLVGPLPREIQTETVYEAAIASDSTAPDAARALLDALATAAVHPMLNEKGMMPP